MLRLPKEKETLMQVSVHLNFNGDCRQAMERYCELMGGEIVSMTTFGATPAGEDVPRDWQDKIIHATMSLGGVIVATADIPPERYQPSQGFNMFVELEEPDEAGRVFDALAEGGEIRMPMQETFWAKRFGVVVDRFGIPWEVNCSQASHE